MARLTEDQELVLRVVEKGHNALISGQAGTGKSYLVKEICSRLKQQGKEVALVCSSGVAGTVYKGFNNSVPTVHSYYGIGTADFPWNALIEKAATNTSVRERLAKLDCLIWDEASMSSQRIFEVTNMIHLKLSSQETRKPFAGKQLIIVGEYLQLRPVPNQLDDGNFMFMSPVFGRAITHRYELVTIMRQDRLDHEFLRCLSYVRVGKSSIEVNNLLSMLARDLTDEIEKGATHIYFRKMSVELHNVTKLNSLQGQSVRLQATDVGDVRGLQCPANEILLLKPGCKVMLTWNKSNDLRNGTRGTFLEMKSTEQMLVEFEDVGKVTLTKETWHKRGPAGNIVGSRTQFPIILMYAITCHKSQGLTLPAAIVHCSKEFVSGLICVSMTRVRSSDHLQVLNFNPRQLVTPPKECLEVCRNNNVVLDAEFRCCRGNLLSEAEMTVHENFALDLDDEEDFAFQEIEEVSKNLSQTYFERGEPDDLVDDLSTVYAILADDSGLDFVKSPPDSFDISKMLNELMVEEPLSTYAEQKNIEVQKLLALSDSTEIFGNILWCRACEIAIEQGLSTLDEVEISSSQWPMNTRALYMLITRSPAYLRDLNMFFQTAQVTEVQSAIGALLMVQVYKEVVSAAREKIKKEEASQPVFFDVREMPVEGLAKLRYVGAWAVRSVLNKHSRYVKTNMTSTIPRTQKQVAKSHEMCLLLEEYIIASFSKLQEMTSHPETLNVTEERQFRCRGLTHIEDCAYEFFVALEVERVQNINDSKLRIKKGLLIEDAITDLKKSESLKRKWLSCFPDVTQANKVLVLELFDLIVEKYNKAGAGQYLRDFRLAHRLKKSAEHRKAVLQRKQALEEKKAAVQFSSILKDRSPGKAISHNSLIVYIDKFGEAAFVRVYKKSQLLKMCEAYDVKCRARESKKKLAQALVPVMRACERVPYPYHLALLQQHVNIDDDNRRITMRFSM